MAEENNRDRGPSEAVTTVISALPKDTKKPRRKHGQRRTAKRQGYSIQGTSLPSIPEEEKKRGVWLTTIANLALLLAVFTIIFAAHRAIQNSKHASNATVVAKVKVVSAPTDVEPAEPKEPEAITEEFKEDAEEEAVKEKIAVEETKKDKSETAKETSIEAPKEKNAAGKYHPDPYTNGGPLDLDRRTPSTAKIGSNTYNELNQNYYRGNDARRDYSPSHNPWNAGGQLDLDSANARQEYLKKNYISSTESDTNK
ncbi:MAG: hypothetical protein COV46_08405 [Deltaproteobacteria bacterium CG11_big_fil_rev_8_21_14_0_20_49_13]|nr:MAG: hypothetical protein COV46_08405 [Deltaproteobacteria bacterium CG11_big_fil_rev_8_21_14_0_20_49_13]